MNQKHKMFSKKWVLNYRGDLVTDGSHGVQPPQRVQCRYLSWRKSRLNGNAAMAIQIMNWR
jgi:hypothetical protein